jgi:hypothetical protein
MFSGFMLDLIYWYAMSRNWASANCAMDEIQRGRNRENHYLHRKLVDQIHVGTLM